MRRSRTSLSINDILTTIGNFRVSCRELQSHADKVLTIFERNHNTPPLLEVAPLQILAETLDKLSDLLYNEGPTTAIDQELLGEIRDRLDKVIEWITEEE